VLNQDVQNCSPAGKTQLPAFLKCKWQDSGVAKGGCGQFISPRYFAENMPKSAVGRMETTSSQPGAMGFEPAVHLLDLSRPALSRAADNPPLGRFAPACASADPVSPLRSAPTFGWMPER
jgi:hypothetical protein